MVLHGLGQKLLGLIRHEPRPAKLQDTQQKRIRTILPIDTANSPNTVFHVRQGLAQIDLALLKKFGVTGKFFDPPGLRQNIQDAMLSDEKILDLREELPFLNAAEILTRIFMARYGWRGETTTFQPGLGKLTPGLTSIGMRDQLKATQIKFDLDATEVCQLAAVLVCRRYGFSDPEPRKGKISPEFTQKMELIRKLAKTMPQAREIGFIETTAHITRHIVGPYHEVWEEKPEENLWS